MTVEKICEMRNDAPSQKIRQNY